MDEDLPQLLRGLLAAIDDRPDDAALRLHAAELLLGHQRPAAAAAQASAVLERDPRNEAARRLLVRAAGLLTAASSPGDQPGAGDGPRPGFDWRAAEAEVAGIIEPAFVEGADDETDDAGPEIERPEVRLSDVGGMEDVKRRLDMTFETARRVDTALREVRPSTGAWLEDARNVVMFANDGGRFDDLLSYLKQRKMA